MKILILIIIWGLIGWWYSNTELFEGLDKKLKLRTIIDLIIILPLFAGTFILLYSSCFFGLLFNIEYLIDKSDDIMYQFMPLPLKRKMLFYFRKTQGTIYISYLSQTPAKLQSIIIDSYIQRNQPLNNEAFEELKTDSLKLEYLDKKSKTEIKKYSWEEEWFKEFTARERERKINEILDIK